ncbi:unnamed protein product, partial [Owenia fusiformis]
SGNHFPVCAEVVNNLNISYFIGQNNPLIMQFDIRRFDIYRKIPKDLTQPTSTGAFISVSSILFITYLFLAELRAYILPEVVSELYVNNPIGHDERIPVRIRISLPNMQCQYLGLDIQDDLGRHEVGFVENTEKTPLGRENEGCMFEAHFKISRVPGNFHVSTHASHQQPVDADMTHYIHEVVFGDDVSHAKLPGNFNPLKNRDTASAQKGASHDYFMKVVPTVYDDIDGNSQLPYQYTYAYRSYMQYGRAGASPAIWFRYEITPITVEYKEKRAPFYTFLTKVCAIVGGTFTVAGIIDSMLFTATELFKKAELGKLT